MNEEQLEKAIDNSIPDWDMSEGEVEVASNDLKILAGKAAELKSQIDKLQFEMDKLKEPYNAICDALQSTLELLEIRSMSAQGYQFKIESKASVKTPKTVEEKQALFQYLESIGLAWEIFSVNSQTLNRTYKDLAEQAALEGNLDFRLPGVEQPKIYSDLKVKKEK